MAKPKALIIGAGIAGIAAAIRLNVKGYEVSVYEANSYAGGKLSAFEKEGYRFDAGPSLFTMPQYVDELFVLAGKNPRDYFTYRRLDINCKYFYEDGTELTAYADEELFEAEVNRLTGELQQRIREFRDHSRRIYEITNPVFLEKSLHRIRTFLNGITFKSFLRIGKIDALRTMHQANSAFFKDKRLVQLFDRYATYNGSDPYLAPATLNVIPHLEQEFGAYFPNGGMYEITTCLVKLAESLGVQFYYNAPVDEIVLKNKVAGGGIVKGEFIASDLVVSNIDVWFTWHKLLRQYPKLRPEKILNQQRSSSALIFYWGIKKQFPQTDLHNIYFAEDYRAEFDSIWRDQTIHHDPTVYLNISSKYQSTDAPAGHENWFVMINVPANTGQNWDEMIASARDHILRKLSRHFNEDIGKLITSQSILDPRSIESRTSAYQGSLYGNSSNGRLAAFLRHANRASKIKNLYFCGGSVHPGGGIPLALLSAKIVSDWV